MAARRGGPAALGSLVVIVEKIARVYNVQTGDCVRVLETETNIDELIGICFDKEGFNVYGCSRDGLLITWTWEKGAVLREFVSSYLITGGMEKVLVKWTIGNLADKANQKEFIPRLPAIVIANAQMRVHCTILECGGLSAAARAGAALLYHRRTACLLMGGRPGHLQLYSTASDKVLCNFLSAAPHMVPPVNLISTAFLEHISGQETTEEPEETEAAMEVDPQSSDDEEEVVSNGADETKTQLWTANYDEVNEKKLRRILKLPVLHKDAAATNVAKADMVHEMGLFEKESHFYSVIKSNVETAAEKQNQWGIVAHACLVQTFWLDDDLTAEHFDDSADFEVYGKVQGVFFRKHTAKKATELGLRGWVMNTPQGTVIGQLQGAQGAIEDMKIWLQKVYDRESDKVPRRQIYNLLTHSGLVPRQRFQKIHQPLFHQQIHRPPHFHDPPFYPSPELLQHL
ncbi:hypothetical protein MSG28_010239 [Choristoneura fumiferana]|uniref:Uncharacterized protein n=1 Tax=Choristoneura fumiferana TaxID=7141 RepID=A0ACC0KJU1_CHOFU|nr:hypothetical protein MSG28_010239 [Choristoneura fumiferana]